ncbi:MAG: FdtA/QdtA family cupin domain-containing protein [Candidatus Thiodiazotropha sp. (ex Monitilora ramsayi)]|nr:FdtA/QdtA family cupin domain-containing protein [Candidatus Thiodiazotropha sp. (ex Monitilora ramsayi)]
MGSRLERCRLIELPSKPDARGNLSFIEGGIHIPFDIQRVYYLYDVPSGISRGAHGHRQLEQFILAMSGSFTITLDDGIDKKTFELNKPNVGLYIPAMLWRDLNEFSSNAVCMVLASRKYEEEDYFRDYDAFVDYAHAGREK